MMNFEAEHNIREGFIEHFLANLLSPLRAA